MRQRIEILALLGILGLGLFLILASFNPLWLFGALIPLSMFGVASHLDGKHNAPGTGDSAFY